MGFFRKAIIDKFIIVAISTGLTMNEKNHPSILSAIIKSKPSYWIMLNPDAYSIFFRSRESNSQSRAELLIKCVQELIVNDDRFADFKVGTNEGELVSELNWLGKVVFLPLGEAVNVAYKNQKGRKELQGTASKNKLKENV